jgi:threonine synthase
VFPEAAACFSAVRRLRAEYWLAEDGEVVILDTGAGLKYPPSRPAELPLLGTGDRIPGQHG